MQNKPTGLINLRLSKQFLKDRSLSVAILANDILHTQYTKRTAAVSTSAPNTASIMIPVASASTSLGGSMPRRADTRVAMQDKVNVTDYNSLAFRWVAVGLMPTLPILGLGIFNARRCDISRFQRLIK